MEMPQNGYIVSYLSNQSEQEAWFDNMSVAVSPGILLEERHYYAYGLPIAGLGSQAATATQNRQRYQGNEYLEELGLEWMDFHNRQYDPQLGRFLSVDPLAGVSGQQVLSPYHAMACNPVSMVDPLGLRAGQFPGTHTLLPTIANAGIHVLDDGTVAVFGGNALNFAAWQARADDRFTSFVIESFIRQAMGEWRAQSEQSGQSGVPESGSVGSGTNQASEGLIISSNGTKYRITHNGGLKVSEILELVNVIGKKADWGDWGKRMNARYGNSFGYGFGGYGLHDGGILNWAKEHFDVVFGYSISHGAQLGGGFEKGVAARVNFYSTVQQDFEWSRRKGIEGQVYELGEKINWGLGGAYYGGVDYKGQTFNGVTEHEIGIGIIGLGVKLKFDDSGKMIDWFWGFDPSLNMQSVSGVELNFRIGFAKK